MSILYFWKPYQPNGWLSQWYPSIIYENGKKFANAEQYMMYHKALLFDDVNIAKCILKTTDPFNIKKLGRAVCKFDQTKWDSNKYKIVTNGTYLKFTQNKILRDKLLNYDVDTRFIEASPYDRTWGIGYSYQDAEFNKHNWGNNLLGQIIGDIHRQLIFNRIFEQIETTTEYHYDGESEQD